MASKIPIVKQISWIGIIPLTILMFVAAFVSKYFINYIGPGIFAVVFLTYILRITVCSYHAKGIRKIKQDDFASAIPYFKSSYDFFSKYNILDRFRCIFLLSTSKITYKEMALLNIAFSYSQIDKGMEAVKWYEKTLEEYPDSKIASTTLKMLKSARDIPYQDLPDTDSNK